MFSVSEKSRHHSNSPHLHHLQSYILSAPNMAPVEKTFPVSELEQRIHIHDVDYKEKSRKLPRGFSLSKDCDLEELVQWSCTSLEEMRARKVAGLEDKRTECYPFVRLFRHCKVGNHDFRVETTAWEGEHKWVRKRMVEEEEEEEADKKMYSNTFAKYGSWFWGR